MILRNSCRAVSLLMVSIAILLCPANASPPRKTDVMEVTSGLRELIIQQDSQIGISADDETGQFQSLHRNITVRLRNLKGSRIRRLRLVFDRMRKEFVSVTTNHADGTTSHSQQQLIQLRGRTKPRGSKKSQKVTATIYRSKSGRHKMSVSFSKERRRTKRTTFYDIKGTFKLSKLKKGKIKAKVSRVPSTSLKKYSCGTELEALGIFDNGQHDHFQTSSSSYYTEFHMVADASFSATYGDDSEAITAAIVQVMNTAGAIYENQLDVSFTLSELDIYTSSDPFTSSTDAVTLLESFRSFMEGFSSDLGHLFTGREIDGGTIGIAYVGALCNSYYGVGLSQYLSNATSLAILFAHEIGHNFGASHDDEVGYIMYPFLGSNDTFSPASLAAMDPSDDACLANTPAPSPSVSPSASPSASIPASPSASSTPSVSPSVSASPSVSPSNSPSPSVSSSPSASPSVSPSSSVSPSASPSSGVSASPSSSPASDPEGNQPEGPSASPSGEPSPEPTNGGSDNIQEAINDLTELLPDPTSDDFSQPGEALQNIKKAAHQIKQVAKQGQKASLDPKEKRILKSIKRLANKVKKIVKKTRTINSKVLRRIQKLHRRINRKVTRI